MIDELQDFDGEWTLAVDVPGAEDVRGRVVFEQLGHILVQSTTVPVPEAPDSCCVVVADDRGGYVQHYFDSRGVARLYTMTFDGDTWTLQRSEPDFTPLEFHQRYVGRFSADRATIDGEWLSSPDGVTWTRDFRLTYERQR